MLKKINFKLNQKGLDMADWPRCLDYGQEIDMEHLLQTSKALGLGLDREEYDLLVNFMADDLSPFVSQEDYRSECTRSGIWIR